MRGRPGQSRYKIKRVTPISRAEFETLLEKCRNDEERGLLTLLFYTGARCSEVVGVKQTRYKVLSEKGKRLKAQGLLPRDWIKRPEREGLWKWVTRKPQPGLLKEDFEIDREHGVLSINFRPVKRGRRVAPVHLPLSLPHIQYIIQCVRKAKPGEQVWQWSRWKVWNFIKRVSGGRLYPHAFRFTRATKFARNPEISTADMQFWFGWRRASTADRYIQPVRSSAKLIKALKEEVG